MITDTIGDCFTRLRNGAKARKDTVVMPYSRMKESLLNLLRSEGFLGEVVVQENSPGKKDLVARLRYHEGQVPVLEHIRRCSKPGHRVYSKIPTGIIVRQGLGFQILTTSKGIMTNRQAIEQKVGGELIGEVW